MYLDAAEGNPDVSIRFTVVIKYMTTPKIPYSSGPKYLPKPKCITYPLSMNTSWDTIRYIVPLAADVIRIEILGVYIKILKRDIGVKAYNKDINFQVTDIHFKLPKCL